MIKFFFFLFFILPFCLFAEWDQLFSSDEDPVMFHHVNVMSGHLTLSIEDIKMEGAEPFSLVRTYTSSGALQRTRFSTDLRWKSLRRGWLIEGGWNFLPHTNLQVIPLENFKKIDFEKIKFCLPEPTGSVLSYSYSHREKIKDHTYYYYYKPKKRAGAHTGVLSVRQDPQNNLLRAEVNTQHMEDFKIKVLLPNGGSRKYVKLSKTFDRLANFYYKLVSEELPSKRHIKYEYDVKDKLVDIKIQKPDGKTTLSWIHLNLIELEVPFQFRAETSDHRYTLYTAVAKDSREYFG